METPLAILIRLEQSAAREENIAEGPASELGAEKHKTRRGQERRERQGG